jgi:Zn-dependent protease with chaperone function
MTKPINYEIHPKEEMYFIIKVMAAVLGYFSILCLLVLLASRQPIVIFPLLFYVSIFIFYLLFQFGFLVGYIEGNAVKVTPAQFPEIYNLLGEQCRQLEITTIPDLYIMQNGGILNAFATKFFGANYIVVYSDVLDEAYKNNLDTVRFIIGHELGHIKRNHLTKSWVLFPSVFIPFLNAAYSRGCEYTCDNIGAALSPNGARPGLLLLVSGKHLWSKVNIEKFTEQETRGTGFWYWVAEKLSTHPHLTKRVLRFKSLAEAKETPSAPIIKTEPTQTASDHSAYFPKG